MLNGLDFDKYRKICVKETQGNRMITFKYLNGQPVEEELDV